VRFEHAAQDTYPFWTGPDNQGRPVVLHDAYAIRLSPHSFAYANHSHLLDGITTSGSLYSAVSSRFSRLRTSRPGGDDAVSRTTSAVGLAEETQRTNINLKLSKDRW